MSSLFHRRVEGTQHGARIALISEDDDATAFISFIAPLTGTRVSLLHASASHLDRQARQSDTVDERLYQSLAAFSPHVMVLCRLITNVKKYMSLAKALDARVIYYLDDNLLAVPMSVGEAVWRRYGSPDVRSQILYAMDHADLVYVSTETLKQRLDSVGSRPIFQAGIYKSVSLADFNRPVKRPEKDEIVFGYMGSSSHIKDLEMMLPCISKFLDERPKSIFELFGSIQAPAALKKYGERIAIVPKAANYSAFIDILGSRRWAFGLAPLENNSFNACKAPTKWIEYTLSGIPTITMTGPVYSVAAQCRGAIVAASLDEVSAGMASLAKKTDASGLGAQLVARARSHILSSFSVVKHRAQLREAFNLAGRAGNGRFQELFADEN